MSFLSNIFNPPRPQPKPTGPAISCCVFPGPGCDPSLTPISQKCYNDMNNYCQQGNNLLNNERCTQWAQANPTQAADILTTVCGKPNMMYDNRCRNDIFGFEQGKLDAFMENYCKTNPHDGLCACINSPMPVAPQVFDKNCMNLGYQTTAMLNDKNSYTYMDCRQYANLSDQAKAVATNISQNCTSTNTTTNQTQAQAQPQPQAQPQAQPSNPKTTSYTIYIVFVFIFIFIIIITIVIYKVKFSKKT